MQFSKMLLHSLYCCILMLSLATGASAQNMGAVEAGEFDMGKMWTFDFPPKEHFQKAYGFTPDDKWFENARLSALRFATYCSASFVSADGLVMTNHHCARESGTESQRAGEDFNNNGFYAADLKSERKVEGLFVDQLVKMEDITAMMQEAIDKGKSDQEKLSIRRATVKKVTDEYKEKTGWKGLEVQVVRFYNGGKFSVYGFKRYNDVRLVFMPELQLGFYGGDYDNFTYPRYALDCSFFRVYGDDGKPLKTVHYFRFNLNGAAEGDPVFVIGNPGSTERLNTMNDLEYKRDVEYPSTLSYLRNRSLLLQEYNKTAKSDSLTNVIFSLENSWKAINGMYDGVKDNYIMARKKRFEDKFRADAQANQIYKESLGLWDAIGDANEIKRNTYPVVSTLSNDADRRGDLMYFAGLVADYAEEKNADATKVNEEMVKEMRSIKTPANMTLEEGLLSLHIQEVMANLAGTTYAEKLKKYGDTPRQIAKSLLGTTALKDAGFREKLILDPTAIRSLDDPMLVLANLAKQQFDEALVSFRSVSQGQAVSRSKLGRTLFDIYGTKVPPDATFSLRINDGVVKGYEYNGTIAPPITTFYGLYDRFYSFKGKKDWDLPKRWQNPPAELLSKPMNFVSTNDIIGGNSGSPIINRNLETVGLVFDGNIESLPGNYIYMPEHNRAVAVHAGGIHAALKYIYKAKRLVKELEQK